MTKDEALDLPDKIYTTREVYCTKEQIQYYHSIKTAAIALLDDGQLVSAPAVMTQLLVTTGAVWSFDDRRWRTGRVSDQAH